MQKRHRPLLLDPDRLFPTEPAVRDRARALYRSVARLPIISPHGHTDPGWFSTNAHFTNTTELLLAPDHYILRMLHSQGLGLDALGVEPLSGGAGGKADPREAWRLFAKHYHLFRGTPSRIWLDWVFAETFGIDSRLDADTSDWYYDRISESLATEAFRPRSLFERYNIEVLATTDSPLDTLEHHRRISEGDWRGRIIPAFRPDACVDPEYEGFRDNLKSLSEISGEDALSYRGYLDALRSRRGYFRSMGATSTDHGHPSAATAVLSDGEAQALFGEVTRPGAVDPLQAELFRAHMLTVMAGMSLDDGLVMQIHPGSVRNHDQSLFSRYGRDRGGDIPKAMDYVGALQPLLNRYGNEAALSLVVFTLDESTYARELAPLAGHYPALKLGPAWWFHDSPEGMRRFRSQTTETAGFYNSVGFNDDTRAFLSIPARHDMARRIDCGYLAQLMSEGLIEEWEAGELAADLAYNFAKRVYKL